MLMTTHWYSQLIKIHEEIICLRDMKKLSCGFMPSEYIYQYYRSHGISFH